jgi:hypothetical protein
MSPFNLSHELLWEEFKTGMMRNLRNSVNNLIPLLLIDIRYLTFKYQGI